ncbi:MAG TPA: hypothetical protein VE093_35710 [Polyangiaceae bacterium]|nr:hypothetical protein [Polyangiaceae bacterium]
MQIFRAMLPIRPTPPSPRRTRLLSFSAARVAAVLVAFAGLGASAIIGASCATATVEGGDGGGDGGTGKPICLLHNCNSDAECAACSLGRNRCLPGEGRCVACDSETETGCTLGETCSEFGQCVPEGLGCPVDDHGQPAVTCATDVDCAACDPQHRICDLSQGGVCVGCTAENTSECPTNNSCVDGACSPSCPKVCTSDEECSKCGAEGSEAHACNAHKCAQCSPSVPCPEGQTCKPSGTCATPCGTDGKGACAANTDCSGCEGEATTCHVSNGSGICGPQVLSCGALAGSGKLLPEPWGSKTSLCESEFDCEGIHANYNVGAVLRNATGIAEIKDATVPYPMHKCAAVTAGSGSMPLVCGVCLPCVVDADCQDIDADLISEKLFGPAGSPEAAALIDQTFGKNDHTVHMYCDLVGGSYGLCAACPGIVYDCGVGMGGGGPGVCDHDVCTAGGPLGTGCDMCASQVCAVDSFCCDTQWDAQCISEVAQYCAGMSCGAPTGCAHDECSAGGKLDPMCSQCATDVCAADAYCCSTAWDATCVSEVAKHCPMKMCGPQACQSPADCPWPLGCLPNKTCGKCTSNADCTPDMCDTFYGECY